MRSQNLYNAYMRGYGDAEFLVGIDEVGRGPIAGPVAVGAVLVPRSFSRSFFKGLKDSKELTAGAREWWCARVEKKNIPYAVSMVSPRIIDTRGIVPAIELALSRALSKLAPDPQQTYILLDGGLKAPPHFPYQRTIIKGDGRIPVIKLASVMAKVTRDQHMRRQARAYPEYRFDQHKGYGTRAHYDCIDSYGLCDLHRKTFVHKGS